jgi:hypothetical protein
MLEYHRVLRLALWVAALTMVGCFRPPRGKYSPNETWQLKDGRVVFNETETSPVPPPPGTAAVHVVYPLQFVSLDGSPKPEDFRAPLRWSGYVIVPPGPHKLSVSFYYQINEVTFILREQSLTTQELQFDTTVGNVYEVMPWTGEFEGNLRQWRPILEISPRKPQLFKHDGRTTLKCGVPIRDANGLPMPFTPDGNPTGTLRDPPGIGKDCY